MAGDCGTSAISDVNQLVACIVGSVSGITNFIETLRERHGLTGTIRYLGLAQQLCQGMKISVYALAHGDGLSRH
jgi:hypothetical protein